MDNKTMTWEQENDLVIEDIFNRFLLKTSSPIEGGASDGGIEFIITPACNQKCEYCYLMKHGDKLYPKDIRDNTTILKNLKIMLNYLLEKDITPKTIDIFSGEIWSSKFGFEILECILDYIKKTKQVPDMVTIPSNCSFLLNEVAKKTIETYIDSFDYYGTRLVFSASVDGPILEEQNRSFKNENKNILRNDDFYKNLFTWCKKYNYGFHPMVNPYSIEKWSNQYDWWIDKMKEYGFDYWSHFMFLEVRDDDWTDEKIKEYLKFLNHALEVLSDNIFTTSTELLRTGLGAGATRDVNAHNYYHLCLSRSCIRQGCNVDRLITIRLGDLAWVPCHRTSYEKLIYGKMKVDNDKIVGIKALNIPLLFSIFGIGYGGHMKCDLCPINRYCIRGCYGAQFEAHKEIFYPCSTVCNLHKAKFLFLYKKYSKLAKELNDTDSINYLNELEPVYNAVEKEYKDKWEPIIQQLI